MKLVIDQVSKQYRGNFWGLRDFSLELGPGEALARMKHGIMQRRLHLEVFRFKLRRGSVARQPGLRWVGMDALTSAPVSGATRKIARAAGLQNSGSDATARSG